MTRMQVDLTSPEALYLFLSLPFPLLFWVPIGLHIHENLQVIVLRTADRKQSTSKKGKCLQLLLV